MIEYKYALYQPIEEKHGKGMFFYTSCCGNKMYSVSNNENKYHGVLCPRCYNIKNISCILFKTGSKEEEQKRKEGLLIEFGR